MMVGYLNGKLYRRNREKAAKCNTSKENILNRFKAIVEVVNRKRNRRLER